MGHGTSVSDRSVVATGSRAGHTSDGISPVMASDHQQMEAVADVNLASRIVFDRNNICQAPFTSQNIYSVTRHVESLDVCMEH
jgi:hypothetical protein